MSDTSASLKGKILSGDRALSQGQLLANVARAATGLSALGIGAEDTVAIMIRNDFPFFEASMAARAVGARSVPINWHYQAEEAGYILRDSQAKALVVHADLLPQVRATIPTSVQTLVVPTPLEIQAAYGISPQQSTPPQDLLEWNAWVSRQKPRELTTLPAPSSMFYTPGTTGTPKGVRREPPTKKSAAKLAEVVEFGKPLHGVVIEVQESDWAQEPAINGEFPLRI